MSPLLHRLGTGRQESPTSASSLPRHLPTLSIPSVPVVSSLAECGTNQTWHIYRAEIFHHVLRPAYIQLREDNQKETATLQTWGRHMSKRKVAGLCSMYRHLRWERESRPDSPRRWLPLHWTPKAPDDQWWYPQEGWKGQLRRLLFDVSSGRKPDKGEVSFDFWGNRGSRNIFLGRSEYGNDSGHSLVMILSFADFQPGANENMRRVCYWRQIWSFSSLFFSNKTFQKADLPISNLRLGRNDLWHEILEDFLSIC